MNRFFNHKYMLVLIIISLCLMPSTEGVLPAEVTCPSPQLHTTIEKPLPLRNDGLSHLSSTHSKYYHYPFVPHQLIIKFCSTTTLHQTPSTTGTPQTGLRSLDRLNTYFSVQSLTPLFPKARKRTNAQELQHFYLLSLEEESDIFQAIERYQQDPHVDYVGPNYLLHAHTLPNDPYYYSSGSWGQDFNDLYGLHILNASGAWNKTRGSQDVVVAVLDTGIDYHHEDITDNMWCNSDEILGNGVDDDDDGFIDNKYGADFAYNDSDPLDDNGHGTHCAGTIAAVGNNSVGVVGVNWELQLMAVKVLGHSGGGGVASLAGGIVWAADNGAKILSNSWGSDRPFPSEPTIEAAVRYAYAQGCTLIFSAGNEEDDVQNYCPQNMPETICVAATDHQDHKALFTNYGKLVDVCAPGVDILSLRANNTDFYGDGTHIVDEEYYYMSGTSMACPHVSGLAALLLAKNQSYTRDTLRTMISYTVDKLNTSYDLGRGRINASRAVQRSPAAIRLDALSTPDNAQGVVGFHGTAWGETFHYYTLTYGKGRQPTSWNLLVNSTTPVHNGTLGEIDTTILDEWYYVIRLQVVCDDATYEQTGWMIVNNHHTVLVVDAEGKPGADCTTIQEGLDNAGYKDTVFVRSGEYYGKHYVKRAVYLMGEEANTTIIDGTQHFAAVTIESSDVSIEQFTLKNTSAYGCGIYSTGSIVPIQNLTIKSNYITRTGKGIKLDHVQNTDICRNTLGNNTDAGAYFSSASYLDISDNVFTDNSYGVYLECSSINTLIANRFSANTNGVILTDYKYPLGCLDGSCNNTIVGNSFINNSLGVSLSLLYGNHQTSDNNCLYHNNFIGNDQAAYDECTNRWEKSNSGNFWDDFEQNAGYPEHYAIPGGGNRDNYPLSEPWCMYYCNLKDVPFYLAASLQGYTTSQMTGAATAQMMLNYLRWNSTTHPEGPPLFYDDQQWLFENATTFNDNTSLNYIDSGGMWRLLMREIVDTTSGYFFTRTGSLTQERAAQVICSWLDFNIESHCTLQLGHPSHAPVLVPTDGNYSHWVVIRGIHTNIATDPVPNGPPENVTVYGFWVNDPLPEGIGSNSYKTAQEFFAAYYHPLVVQNDPYQGKYIAIADPPESYTYDNNTQFSLHLAPCKRPCGSHEQHVVVGSQYGKEPPFTELHEVMNFNVLKNSAYATVQTIAESDTEFLTQVQHCSPKTISYVHSQKASVDDYVIVVLADTSDFEIAVLMNTEGDLLEFSYAHNAQYSDFLEKNHHLYYYGGSKYYPTTI
jgi:parallel beta-helix repeat protein